MSSNFKHRSTVILLNKVVWHITLTGESRVCRFLTLATHCAVHRELNIFQYYTVFSVHVHSLSSLVCLSPSLCHTLTNTYVYTSGCYTRIYRAGITTYSLLDLWHSRKRGFAAVSYTHLDVYKRQEYTLPRAWQILLLNAKRKYVLFLFVRLGDVFLVFSLLLKLIKNNV